MRAICLLLISMVTFVSCSTSSDTIRSIELNDGKNVTRGRQDRLLGKLDVSRFSQIQKIGLNSQLSVSLETPEGVSVDKTSQLRPNTTYYIKLNGKGADRVEVRSCFGFEILSKKEEENRGKLAATYLIKTQSDVTEPLFVSFLPLRITGESTFREKPQNFWLTGAESDN